MVAEIIFFIALAILIILLGRRTALLRTFWQRITSFSKGHRSSVRLPNRFPFQSRPKQTDEESNQSEEHGFWGEETPTGKHDLPSGYEEADVLAKAGRIQQAEQILIKAASKSPSDPKIYAKLGLLYLQQKSHSDAIESLKVAAKLDRYNPSRHYNLALAYWGNKDIQRAIMSVREAISLDPVTQKYRQLLEQLLNGK